MAEDFTASRAIERVVQPARQKAHSEIKGIIEAAWEVLAATGWADLKIGMVLERAHISTRSFYRNFSGKSELLVALFEEEVTRFAAGLVRHMRDSESAADQVATWIGHNLRRAYSTRSRARTQLFAAEGPALAPEFPEDVQRIRLLLLDPLADAITRGRADGAFDVPSPMEAATMIWLITSSLMREPHAGQSRTARWEDAFSLVCEYSFRMLGATEETAKTAIWRVLTDS